MEIKLKIQKLQQRVDWLEQGLVDIYQDLVGKPMKRRDHKDAQRLLAMVQSIMDGEPTTADTFNKDVLDSWESQHWKDKNARR